MGDLLAEHLALVHESGMRKRGVCSEHREVLEDIGGFIRIRSPKSHRVDQNRVDTMTMKSIINCVDNKLAFLCHVKTVHAVAHLLNYEPDTESALDDLVSNFTLQRGALHLLDATDAHLRDRIAALRGTESFGGLGFETDESPPAGKRFAGLRFQATIAYVSSFPPIEDWCSEKWNGKAPIQVESLLCDIVNAPAKDGATVGKIVAMQLNRFGCNLADIVSGSTDGGGENEGKHGVHAMIEDISPLYVRRRGLEHLSWNFCSAGLAASGEIYKQLRQLSSYLSEGITWNRLKEIATSPVANGGPHY